MIIGVFGTWRAVEGDRTYLCALDYGRALGCAGHQLLTGGYSGVMEAACRGAVEAGARTIGVTCPEFDNHLRPNRWITEEVRARDIQDRLAMSFRLIDGAVFFPGRAGTATELSFALELRDKGVLRYPLLLTCDYWDEFLRAYAVTNGRLTYPSSDCGGGALFRHCAAASDAVLHLGTKQ